MSVRRRLRTRRTRGRDRNLRDSKALFATNVVVFLTAQDPGNAHKAIAKLVARGAILVIGITNFDRLLEQALEAEGIMPQAVSAEAEAYEVATRGRARFKVNDAESKTLEPCAGLCSRRDQVAGPVLATHEPRAEVVRVNPPPS